LLRLYPASFRAEYGAEIARIFRERRREASGVFAVLALWAELVADTITAAIPAHADILRQDLAYTMRALGRSPGFTVTAIVVTALGIGATTAAFSVADYTLLRPLPFRDSDRLVKLWENDRIQGFTTMDPSPANYRDWKAMAHSFTSMAAYSSVSINLTGNGPGDGSPERLDGAAFSAGLLDILDVRPVLGRAFTQADDLADSPPTIILSDSLWRRRFGGDPGVLGRTVRLDDAPFTVIGVMPPDFAFPSRLTSFWKTERFSDNDFSDRSNHYLRVLAKLAPGVSLEQARAEMNAVAARLEQTWAKDNKGVGATTITFRDEIAPRSRMLVMALAGAAICVLLIGCTNLANLLLARALSRRKELAVRAAIGAGRERLVRQLMTESLVLSLGGGAIGVVLARAALPLLAKLAPAVLPMAQDPTVDGRVLFAAAVLSIGTGIAFGVVPALRASGAQLSGLRDGMREGGGRRERLRGALTIAEVTLSVVLLVSCGLLIRALWRLQTVDPGFRSDGVLTMRTSLPMPKYAATMNRVRFYRQVLDQVRGLPGVTSAAYTSFLPMAPVGGIFEVEAPGHDPASGLRSAMLRYVTPDYFSTMGIPLRLGRDVTENDTAQAPFAAVVSEGFADRYWKGENPIGRRFKIAFFERVVVGVVSDIRARGIERQTEPQVYLSYQQIPNGYMPWHAPKDLAIRSSSATAALVPALRQIVAGADPGQPISDVRMMSEIVGGEMAPRLVQVRVLGAFAIIAFVLAAVGIHGLLSFAVSTRSREIGVRMALGAGRADILGMVAGTGLRLAAMGTVLGAGLAFLAARALKALLAGISPGDALVWTAALALCLVMTVAGSLLPAIRAMRVDPVTAIRYD
jgi:predicted permease